MTYTSTMTAAAFIVFLGKLVAGASQKIFLIADRLKAHDAKAVDKWGCPSMMPGSRCFTCPGTPQN